MAESLPSTFTLPCDVWRLIIPMITEDYDFEVAEFADLSRTCRMFKDCIEPILFSQLWGHCSRNGGATDLRQTIAMCNKPRLRLHFKELCMNDEYEPYYDSDLSDGSSSDTEAGPCADERLDTRERREGRDHVYRDSDDDDDSFAGDFHTPNGREMQAWRDLCVAVTKSHVLATPAWDEKLGAQIMHGLQEAATQSLWALLIWICPRLDTLEIHLRRGLPKTQAGRILRKLAIGPHPALHIKELTISHQLTKGWRFLLRLPSLKYLTVEESNIMTPFAPHNLPLLPYLKCLDLTGFLDIAAVDRILADCSLRSLKICEQSSQGRLSLADIAPKLKIKHANLESLCLDGLRLCSGWSLRVRSNFPVDDLTSLHRLKDLEVCEIDLFGTPTATPSRVELSDILPRSLVSLQLWPPSQSRGWEPPSQEFAHMTWVDKQCESLACNAEFPDLLYTKVDRTCYLDRLSDFTIRGRPLDDETYLKWTRIPLGGFWQRTGTVVNEWYGKKLREVFDLMSEKRKQMQTYQHHLAGTSCDHEENAVSECA